MAKDKIAEAKYIIKNTRQALEEEAKEIESRVKDLLDFIQKVNSMVYSEADREAACVTHGRELVSNISEINRLMNNIISKSSKINAIEEVIYSLENDTEE